MKKEKIKRKIKQITIICPVYNEELNIVRFIESFNEIFLNYKKRYQFSYLFLDNNSVDQTIKILLAERAKFKNISIIKYSRNFGVMKSIFTGIVNLNSETNACAIFDCDLQDPPELLVGMIEKWEEGYQIVYGLRSKRKENFLISFFRNRYKNLEKLLKGKVTQIESGVWFLDKRVITELKLSRFEPYLAGLISRLGFKSTGITYSRNIRRFGDSKFNFLRYIGYAIDGLVSGTIAPLRISVLCGLFISFLSFLMAVYFIYAKFYLGIQFQAGMIATIVILLFGFGLNFIFLGLIGEYLGRIYLNEQDSTTAIIDEFYDKKNN